MCLCVKIDIMLYYLTKNMTMQHYKIKQNTTENSKWRRRTNRNDYCRKKTELVTQGPILDEAGSVLFYANVHWKGINPYVVLGESTTSKIKRNMALSSLQDVHKISFIYL